jgi:hypothetical protein
VKASAFVYPWDVNGDPQAPARIAALGVEQVTLAAAYHSTRALTPRHPRHRIVTAEHAAVLYPADDRWERRQLRPYASSSRTTPGWAPSTRTPRSSTPTATATPGRRASHSPPHART